MVQITSVIVAVMVAVTPVAQAAACNPGFDYCGYNLKRLYSGEDDEDDLRKIRQAIKKAHFRLEYSDVTLFHCNSDESITAMKVCNDFCTNGGQGMNDECFD
ncbi:hypothetical protein E4U38_003173 [Claviceps purpurea]|nr:hypothetical protein E4U38_003173 [Claviceps purpurea]KAG6235484.1 hypothetical protein E4U25_004758 [Claviceps purpurea]